MNFYRLLSALFFISSLVAVPLAQEASSLSPGAQTIQDSGATVAIEGEASAIRIPLAAYNVFTDVIKFKDAGEPTLLFFVIKMPNGFGKLFVTRSRLKYEPEGGINAGRFEIERSTIQSMDMQVNWQTVQNYPNINVVYKKDKKQFAINRVKPSSDYAQIDLTKFWVPTNFLKLALDDFDKALAVHDEVVSAAKVRTQKEADEKAAAEAAAAAEKRAEAERRAEEIRKARERWIERLKLSQRAAEQRRLYNQEVLLFIENKTPQLRRSTPAVKAKVLDAIAALRKMSAAAEVGVIFTDYSSRLIDTKAVVDEAIELLPENHLRKELFLAMEAYVDAGKAWNELNTNKILVESHQSFWHLVDRYGLDPDLSNPIVPVLGKQQILSLVWADGISHVRNAAALSSF